MGRMASSSDNPLKRFIREIHRRAESLGRSYEEK